MPDPQVALASAFAAAIEAAFGPDWAGTDPVIRSAKDGVLGDYQANAAMALGKALGRQPREVAADIVAHLDVASMCSAVEVAGPGFVNLTLDDGWLGRAVSGLLADSRIGVVPAPVAKTVVVDYSSPNLAKEMHIGHLRSTVIGDAIVRVLEALGHRVIRQNHLGDWGTQFGMLIEHLDDHGWSAGGADHKISDLNELYRQANRRFEDDPTFAERARQRVVALQRGDPETLAAWSALVAESERHMAEAYARLGVRLTPDDIRGESFYNDRLAGVADELEERGLAVVDDGALCVFPPGFTGRDGQPLPLIVRKSDGGFGYAATDLAALRFRAQDLAAERIVYVVDARQTQHFAMVFAAARLAGWLGESVSAEHVAFGTILGTDGRPFRTRSGDLVTLADLLDEAELRAAAIVADKNPALEPAEAANVARAVGIGAVKFADLTNDRVKDYVFDWDRMLSFDGNTAPYLQYAYVRVRGIFRRAERQSVGPDVHILVGERQERALALTLVRFDGAVQSVAATLQPHRLCTYLLDLAQAFTAFIEACPVLRASAEIRQSRLALCEATARVLAAGLGMLGIDTVEQM